MSSPESDPHGRESSFYPSIVDYIERRIKAELGDGFDFRMAVCGVVDMRDGLRRINRQLHHQNESLDNYAERTRGLFVDLAGILQSRTGNRFATLICEVKVGRLNLTHLAQLLGYCIASNTRHGLLISVNHSVTSGLEAVLRNNHSIVDVRRLDKSRHTIGIATWTGGALRFDDIGFYTSVESLGRSMSLTL